MPGNQRIVGFMCLGKCSVHLERCRMQPSQGRGASATWFDCFIAWRGEVAWTGIAPKGISQPQVNLNSVLGIWLKTAVFTRATGRTYE